jgi:LysM repeat protein
MLRRSMATLLVGASLVFSGTQAFAATHKAEAGDTLWKLAKKYHVSVLEMERANPNLVPRNIQIGQSICIPTTGKYVVKQNDTFWSISQDLHIPVDTLLNANPCVNPMNLYPGIVLKLPKHTTPAKPAVKAIAKKPNTKTNSIHIAKKVSATNANAQVASVQESRQIVRPTNNQSQNVVTVGGQAIPFAKEINGVATAYTASAASNGSWGAFDYFGNPLRLGTIAVDPNVIPLGSRVYVTGYSFDGLPAGGMVFTARDVGGGIQGSHIDIFIPTSDGHASDFGIQNVKMYILK